MNPSPPSALAILATTLALTAGAALLARRSSAARRRLTEASSAGTHTAEHRRRAVTDLRGSAFLGLLAALTLLLLGAS